MKISKFASPREEALELAYQTRKGILGGKQDPVSILRACLVIADNLNKDEAKEWITLELSGYPKSDKLPSYRKILCPYEKKGLCVDGFYNLDVRAGAHFLYSYLKIKEDLRFVLNDDVVAIINQPRLDRIFAGLVDRCLFFLNDIIAELQYGGVVEFLMEEIRKNTDEKLAKLDRNLMDEAQSLCINLKSTNPADWNKVGHSCRKILKLLADKVFPPRDESYQMKDNRIVEVRDPHFINRLCAFIDQKIGGEERKFLMAEIEYLESYLRQIVQYSQMAEHKPSIKKFHANMIAICTYLVISEILKLYSEQLS